MPDRRRTVTLALEMARELIEVEEAARLVLQHAAPLGPEPVDVAAALGRVLAEPVESAESVPAFDNSAMDGYAVRAADTAGAGADRPARLELVDESRAGRPATHLVAPGEAIAISTGAMIPEGADAVVRVEDTDGARGGQLGVRVEVEPGRDIRRAGEDVTRGERVLEPGTDLGPAEIGVLASVGRQRVAVGRRPRVAVLTTGDELQEPGEPLRRGAVRNSNAHTLPALVERAGGEPALVELVPDEADATRGALDRGLVADVTVVSGGVSVGEHDHVRGAFESLGVERVFWGVALRPGKPTYFGVAPRRSGVGVGRTLAFGLPGNPVSAMVTFLLFVRPAIRAMLGADPSGRARASAILDAPYRKRPGRAHLVRCRLELRDDGWHATPTKEQGSHVLTSMLGADALAILPTDAGDLEPGDRVEIQLL
jgi:molybdopterin molybdotransferase